LVINIDDLGCNAFTYLFIVTWIYILITIGGLYDRKYAKLYW
jgi:hypothetical protein